MTLTLIVSLAIVALGLAGLFNMNRAGRFLDGLLVRFSKLTRTVIRYALLGLLSLLWLAAVYSVYVYSIQGSVESIPDSLEDMRGAAEGASDYIGDKVKRQMGRAYADVRGLHASTDLQEPGHAHEEPQVVHKMGPNLSDVMSGSHERFHTPRLDVGLGDECSRTIKDSGNCWGVSRHFVDGQHVNQCNKIFVRAPQAMPFNAAVKFPL